MGSLQETSESTTSQQKKVQTNDYHNELTCVMGSPLNSAKQLLHTLEWEPEQITWSAERRATLHRGPQGKLGFTLKTFQGNTESFSVVLKVKEDCNISSGQLRRYDRIISVNNYDITNLSEQYVTKIFAKLKCSELILTLCRPEKFKVKSRQVQDSTIEVRFDSQNSSLDVNISGTSVGLNSLNSVETNSTDLNELLNRGGRNDASAEVTETCFNVSVRTKDLKKISDIGSVNSNRNSSDSSTNEAGLEVTDYKIKRGISQVSSSDSNRSQSSLLKETMMRRREKSSKSTKFVKTGSIDNTDDEVEPLHPGESTSPRPVGKLDKYSHFNVDDRSYSMPTTVSVADIVVEDPTLSLPTGYNSSGLPQGHTQNCQCGMCLPGQDQKVCSKCSLKTKPPSPRATLFLDSQQSVSLPEEYGHMVLQTPQYAVWDGKNTHVVEIDRGKSKGFGFSYKVKLGKNQDSSVETYTLVDHVDKNGPSREKLRVGDWVRSVNGTPIQKQPDAVSLLYNSNKQKNLRLVIQRPVGLSQSQQTERDRTVQDLNPSSPQSPCSPGDQDPLIPGTIEPQKNLANTVIPPNIYVIDSCNGEGSSTTVLLPFPKSVKLTKVRIFLCGSEADKCLNYLLKDSALNIEIQNQCYTYTSCSMSTDCVSNILISAPCSNLFSYSVTSPRNCYVNQSDHRGGGDSKCKECGGDFPNSAASQNHGQSGSIVNVEMFAVPDDRFFHFCCSYLFTKSSIFILTFDGSKLLRSAASEFTRLQNLSHTIRSIAGEEVHIMSRGFIDGGPDASHIRDEVRALFYTPLNSVLQNFHVFGPEFVDIHSQNTPTLTSDNPGENQLLQALWKVVMETVQRQQVLQPSLLLIDLLVSLREKEFIITESQLMEIIQSKLPSYQLDVHQMILTYLIENREILLGKASSFINSTFHKQIESLILTDPKSLLTCLHRIITIVTEDKPNWLKMHSTGFIKSSNFLEIFSDSDKYKQVIADFMECNGIIMKRPNADNSALSSDYFFPYFSVTPSTADKQVIENREYELYLKFVDHESTQIYFALLFTIASQCDLPSSFSVQDVQTCVFLHMGYHAVVCHQKVDDRVHFIFRREDKATSAKPVELYSWLKDMCHMVLDSLFVSFILGAPCPRGEQCSRTTSTGVHVIDLREKKPQYCDQERVDTMKQIRMWKQKDVPAQETVLSVSKKSSKPAKQPVSLLDLPHSVFHNVCARLRVQNSLDRNWVGLAGLMGYSSEDVQIMKSVDDPVKELLYDWSTTYSGKIDELIKLLDQMKMENVLSYLRQSLPQNSLNTTSSPVAIQNSVVSFQNLPNSTEFSGNSGLSTQVIYQRSKVTETEVMPLTEEGQGQGHTIKLNNLDNTNQMDSIVGSANQAITPVETVMDINQILKS